MLESMSNVNIFSFEIQVGPDGMYLNNIEDDSGDDDDDEEEEEDESMDDDDGANNVINFNL